MSDLSSDDNLAERKTLRAQIQVNISKTFQDIDMHLLLDLLSVLFLGITCFAVNHLVGGWKSRIRRRKVEIRVQSTKKRKRSLIEKELDYLLLQYNQGLLTEQQYHQMTNSLIDKLIELESPPVEV